MRHVTAWTFALNCLASLLAIINPFGAVPIYLTLVQTDDLTRRKVRWLAATTVTVTLLIFAAFGQSILGFFGISLSAFRVGGGILLLMMAVSMLHAKTSHVKHTPEEADEAAEAQSVAIMPLSIPILAGPGAITTVILLSEQADTWARRAILAAVIVACGLTVIVFLSLAESLQRYLKTTGINIATRVMGLLLAAIAVQFIVGGVGEMLPGLAD